MMSDSMGWWFSWIDGSDSSTGDDEIAALADAALRRLFKIQFRLGRFDPVSVPGSKLTCACSATESCDTFKVPLCKRIPSLSDSKLSPTLP